VGTAERTHSTPKAASVKANRTLDAVSDGAFAATPMNAQGEQPIIVPSHQSTGIGSDQGTAGK